MSVIQAWKPPPRLTISEWADSYRKLSSESSAEPGQWVTSRAEYQRGIMDAVSDAKVETVVIMSSAQVGKTEIINNVVGFYVSQDPAPILLVQPTVEMGNAWSKDRLAPMIRDTPALRERISDSKSRDSGNTMSHKTFPGGHLTISGANSPASLASRPIRVVLLDEVDRYPPSAGAEGDPVNLARKRATTFWNRKVVMTSTPTIKGASRIEAAFEESDKRRFFVPCPDCGDHQHLKWSQVQWGDGEPDSAMYICEHCGSIWDDVARWKAVRLGEWRATNGFKGVAGFHLNEIYSPWVKLSEMAAIFLEAKKLPETLKTFVNTSLGETWEDKGEAVVAEGLFKNCDEYDAGLIPAGVVLVTAGIDVQDDRLECEVVGWGHDDESWSLEYQVFHGDPSGKTLWQTLDDFLKKRYEREGGAVLSINAACIDSGGHHTQAVYDFVRPRARQRRRVRAIKGMGGPGRPIWPAKASRNNIGKVPLYIIGVDSAKERIYSRLAIEGPGPGYCHFPESYDEKYFEGLTAEKVITKYSKGFPVRQWVPKTSSIRNEPLDCRVYALAAYISLNANTAKVAERLRKQVAPPVVEKESPADNGMSALKADTAPPADNKAPRKSRRGRARKGKGFANNWR